MKFQNSNVFRIFFSVIWLISVGWLQSSLSSKTKLYTIEGNKYISAIEYAESQDIRTIFYDDKEKLEFRFQSIKLTARKFES